MRANEVAAAIHRDMCEDERNGYSWSPRHGGDHPDGRKALSVGGHEYSYPLGSWDCSSSVIKAYELALGRSLGCSTTFDMKAAFLATGLFEWKPMSFTADVGDLYLNERNHVAMCQSQVPDTLSEFSIDENGGVYGGRVGDQTGWESHVCAYYDYPWDGILHYAGGDAPGAPDAPKPAKARKPECPRYRVFRDGNWRAWRTGNRAAGRRGSAVWDMDFDGLGPGGWFQLTLEGGEVLPRNARNDAREKRVIGVTAYYATADPARTGWWRARYRAHVLGGGWLGPEFDDEGGGAGDDAHPIDRFRLRLAR